MKCLPENPAYRSFGEFQVPELVMQSIEASMDERNQDILIIDFNEDILILTLERDNEISFATCSTIEDDHATVDEKSFSSVLERFPAGSEAIIKSTGIPGISSLIIIEPAHMCSLDRSSEVSR